MKKPKKIITITKGLTITNLSEALAFQSQMIEVYGEIAKDNSLYQLNCSPIDSPYKGYEVYIEFRFNVENQNYEIEKRNKAIEGINKRLANLGKENLKINDKLNRLTTAIDLGVNIPNINEQIDHLKKAALKINEQFFLLKCKKSLIIGGEEVKEEFLKELKKDESYSQLIIRDDLKYISDLISEVS